MSASFFMFNRSICPPHSSIAGDLKNTAILAGFLFSNHHHHVSYCCSDEPPQEPPLPANNNHNRHRLLRTLIDQPVSLHPLREINICITEGTSSSSSSSPLLLSTVSGSLLLLHMVGNHERPPPPYFVFVTVGLLCVSDHHPHYLVPATHTPSPQSSRPPSSFISFLTGEPGPTRTRWQSPSSSPFSLFSLRRIHEVSPRWFLGQPPTAATIDDESKLFRWLFLRSNRLLGIFSDQG
jgi:hypothetical protein